MKKHLLRNKKMRYGALSIALIALVIAVAVLANTVFDKFAKKYSWYLYMNNSGTYDVSDTCYQLIGQVMDANKDNNGELPKINIIFCKPEDELKEDTTGVYVLHTAKEIAERYSNISIVYNDIWTNPNSVKPYRVSYNPIDGTSVETSLKSTNIIVTCEDYYRVYDITEFFVFADSDTSNCWAYDGERVLSSAILRASDKGSHIVCLTSNHGEAYYDYEIIYLLDDAGYTVYYMDLYKNTIPANCDMIISYNPNTDLIEDEVASKSEIAILNDFLSVDGHKFLLFLENGTPVLPNYEKLMKEWGVSLKYATVNENEYRYSVADASQTLTSDGYTIYGQIADNKMAQSVLENFSRTVIFKDSTAISAADGFTINADGIYTNSTGNRIMYPLYTSSSASVSWANGTSVNSGKQILASMSEQTNDDAKSYFGVFTSADYATEDFLQSAVYGNTDLLMHLFHYMGKQFTTEGLNLKPFNSTTISTITTSQMVSWTVCLSIIPVIILAGLCTFVIVRRRRS